MVPLTARYPTWNRVMSEAYPTPPYQRTRPRDDPAPASTPLTLGLYVSSDGLLAQHVPTGSVCWMSLRGHVIGPLTCPNVACARAVNWTPTIAGLAQASATLPMFGVASATVTDGRYMPSTENPSHSPTTSRGRGRTGERPVCSDFAA